MHTAGTSTVGRLFCRRASRSNASGRKTEAAEAFLLLKIGGMCDQAAGRSNSGVVIRRHLDCSRICEATSHHRFGGLGGRQSKVGLWTQWLTQHHGLLARPLVPVNDGEVSTRLERLAYGGRQPGTIGDTMESVRQEDKIDGPRRESGQLIGVADQEVAVRQAALFKARAGSTSIATTCRASLAICKVNQSSPEQRSMTSIPGLMPTAVSRPTGSGHSASHHPAAGISVASKNPDGFMIRSEERIARRARGGGAHA
jgi:hypothetical protein